MLVVLPCLLEMQYVYALPNLQKETRMHDTNPKPSPCIISIASMQRDYIFYARNGSVEAPSMGTMHAFLQFPDDDSHIPGHGRGWTCSEVRSYEIYMREKL